MKFDCLQQTCYARVMARSVRIECPGAFYHVMARGNPGTGRAFWTFAGAVWRAATLLRRPNARDDWRPPAAVEWRTRTAGGSALWNASTGGGGGKKRHAAGCPCWRRTWMPGAATGGAAGIGAPGLSPSVCARPSGQQVTRRNPAVSHTPQSAALMGCIRRRSGCGTD